MSFNSVIGHNKQIEYLKEVIKNNRLPHALMLEGREGVGKNTLALQVAQALFCDNSTGDACGECRNCIKMMHNNHPDFMLIEPDGAQIKNAQIELFQAFVKIIPYDANYKVIIIKDADKMNVSSQNRILKTLEEPPVHVVVILLTTNSESLLPTVLSRTLILKLSGTPQDLVVNYLKSNYDICDDDAVMIAKLSEGSIGKAIEYFSSDTLDVIRQHTEVILNAINNKERSKLLGELSYLSSDKDNIQRILDYMILWYRDILLFKQAKAKQLLVHSQSLEFIKKLTRNLSLKKIILNIEVIETTKRKLRQHAHFDLTMEVMLIKLLED